MTITSVEIQLTTRTQYGVTALHAAVRYNSHACVALLLKHGADYSPLNNVRSMISLLVNIHLTKCTA